METDDDRHFGYCESCFKWENVNPDTEQFSCGIQGVFDELRNCYISEAMWQKQTAILKSLLDKEVK